MSYDASERPPLLICSPRVHHMSTRHDTLTHTERRTIRQAQCDDNAATLRQVAETAAASTGVERSLRSISRVLKAEGFSTKHLVVEGETKNGDVWSQEGSTGGQRRFGQSISRLVRVSFTRRNYSRDRWEQR